MCSQIIILFISCAPSHVTLILPRPDPFGGPARARARGCALHQRRPGRRAAPRHGALQLQGTGAARARGQVWSAGASKDHHARLAVPHDEPCGAQMTNALIENTHATGGQAAVSGDGFVSVEQHNEMLQRAFQEGVDYATAQLAQQQVCNTQSQKRAVTHHPTCAHAGGRAGLRLVSTRGSKRRQEGGAGQAHRGAPRSRVPVRVPGRLPQ